MKEQRSLQQRSTPRTPAEWPALLDSRLVWCETWEVDSLQEILSGKTFQPPDEVGVVKDYVSRRYNSRCKVQVHPNSVILIVPNSGLAATLQLERQKLIEVCSLKKRLVIRIGR